MALNCRGALMNVRYRVELDPGRARAADRTAERWQARGAQTEAGADPSWRPILRVSDEAIATSLAIAGSTIYRTKRRFVEGDLEAALFDQARPGAARKLTGKEEALLVATAERSQPEGRARWTLELLAGAMVKLTEHEDLSRDGASAPR